MITRAAAAMTYGAWLIVFAVAVCPVIAVAQEALVEGQAGALEELQKQFKTAIFKQEVLNEKSRSDLHANYESALGKVESKAKEKGELELVLAVREELEAFPNRKGPVAPSGHTKLVKAQEIYESQIGKIRAEREAKIRRLSVAYRKQLESLQKSLTKDGEIDEALKVKGELDEFRIKGRYVKIDLPGSTEYLSLAEVQVFSHGANIALKGTVTQSSGGVANAKVAIDGVTSGDKDWKITHTNGERSPWWELDLGAERPLSGIKVWNRTAGNLYVRLNGFRVGVLDERQEVVWEQNYPKAPEESLMIDFGYIFPDFGE